MLRSAQATGRRDGRDVKDLASRQEVGAGSIGVPRVVAVVDAATGAHAAVVVRVRAAKSVVAVVVGEIRLVDLRNGVPMVVASIQQRPPRLQRDDGERRRDAQRLLVPRSTIHKAFDRCFR